MTFEYESILENLVQGMEMLSMLPPDLELDSPIIQGVLESMPEERKTMLTAMLKDPGIRRMFIANSSCMAQYFKILHMTKETGKKIVWVPFTFTPEILWAMDLIPATVESLAMVTGENEKYIDLSYERGLPDTMCSSHKGTIGLLEAGVIDKPDLVINAALGSCDPNSKALEYISEKWDVPSLYIDIPYYNDNRSLEYFTHGYKEMITALEEMTGNKLDPDRLREVIDLSNEANELNNEISVLKRNIPNPVPNYYTADHLNIRLSNLGTQRAVDYMKVALEVSKERLKDGKSVAPEEKVRYMNMYTGLYTDATLQSWFQEEIGVSYLTDFLDWYDLSPFIETTDMDTMIAGLADELFKVPMSRQMKTGWNKPGGWGTDLLYYAETYKPDCLVFTGHVACKHAWGLYRLVSDYLKKETGIPCIRLEADAFDSRITPMPIVKEQLEEFFQTLE